MESDLYKGAEEEPYIAEIEWDGESTIEDIGSGDNAPTKFSKYVLPGGENYREVLLTMPREDGQEFKSSHFDEENILAHTRLTDRVDENGDKVLFVEEIQSDWHQAGREKGYKESLPGQENFNSFLKRKYPEKINDAFSLWQNKSNEIYKEWSDLQDKIMSNQQAVPDAPFRKSWHEFTFKKILMEAAQKGYKKVAWTTGDQQAERYTTSPK